MKNTLMRSCHMLLAVMTLALCQVAAGEDLPGYKQTDQQLYLTAAEAYAMKQEKGDAMALIDVRTRAEIAFVGMPTDADANVPFLHVNFDQLDSGRGSFAMTPNPDFAASVDKLVANMGLDKNRPIAVMCRSGGRSAAAANLLASQGYTRVYTVTDGFEGDKAKTGPDKGRRVVNGWKNSGAPWTTKIDPEKLY